MIEKPNPVIAKYDQEVDFTLADPLDIKQTNAKIAVSFQGYLEQDHKDDPRYVKWMVRLFGNQDYKRFERHVPFHICTDEDYDQFFPITPSQEGQMKRFREGGSAKMICIDWDDEEVPFDNYGLYSDPNWQRLEYVMLPCNYVHKQAGDIGDFVAEECETDPEK